MSSDAVYILGCAAPPVRELAEPVALLRDAGWSPCVILTPTAVSWVDVEGFDVPVRVQPRLLSEPDPLPPADAVLAAPVTFHSLNKVGAGLNDTMVVCLLNELLGYELPTVVAPCVKSQLRRHPAYAASLRVLTSLSAHVLDPDKITYRGPDGLAVFEWEAVVTEFLRNAQGAR